MHERLWECDSGFWKLRKHDKHINIYFIIIYIHAQMIMWWTMISLIISLPYIYILFWWNLSPISRWCMMVPTHNPQAHKRTLLSLILVRTTQVFYLPNFFYLFRIWRHFWTGESTAPYIREQAREFLFWESLERKSETQIFILCIFSGRDHVWEREEIQ